MHQRSTRSEAPVSAEHLGAPPGWPTRVESQQVAFVTGDGTGQTTLMEFTEPRACRAIVQLDAAAATLGDMTLLLVPTSDQEDPELAAKVWSWVEPGVSPELRRGALITLQGARVIWTPGRAGILAAPERLDTLRRAVLEFSLHDGEVRAIEQEIARSWADLEADTPLAFRFEGQAAPRRDQLADRFQKILGLRTRLVRISPVVHHPPLHPPTLASQLKERLKERTRLAERIEFVGDQIEVFEGVYELCGQRSSEFATARSEALLTGTLIVLVAMETVVLLVELVSGK